MKDDHLDTPGNKSVDIDRAEQEIIGTKGGPIICFPTICYVLEHQGTDELNAELARIALADEAQNKTLNKGSIRGGYHSRHGVFNSDNWAAKGLKELIYVNYLEYLKTFWQYESREDLSEIGRIDADVSAWSVILREGATSIPHVHPQAHLSGVYYISTPNAVNEPNDESGNLVLQDPRPMPRFAPIRGQASFMSIEPKAGMIVMFPSYVEHYVLPFYGDGTRISTAFNIHLSKNAITC